MPKPAEGQGSAFGATVETQEWPIDDERIAEGHAQALATHQAEYAAAITAAQARVERQQAHLAEAQASLARIQAEWASWETQLKALGT